MGLKITQVEFPRGTENRQLIPTQNYPKSHIAFDPTGTNNSHVIKCCFKQAEGTKSVWQNKSSTTFVQEILFWHWNYVVV